MIDVTCSAKVNRVCLLTALTTFSDPRFGWRHDITRVRHRAPRRRGGCCQRGERRPACSLLSTAADPQAMQSDPSAHHLGSGSGHNVHPGSSGRTGDHHDTHGTAHHSDNSPFPPASPNLSTAFHRPQHTGNEQELSSVPQLRRRITQPSKGDTIRIAIATPLSDRDRRKERDISAGSTIAQVKDIIAGDEEESWERSSMRLIWNGRVLRDEEVLRDFLITVSYTAQRFCAADHGA